MKVYRKITGTDTCCTGESTGKAEVLVSGGVAPYTYSWDCSKKATGPIMENLAAGTYHVMVTDAVGATTSCEITISAPPELGCETVWLRDASTPSNKDGSASANLPCWA